MPSPTTTSIAITLPAILRVGQTVRATATSTLSDASTAAVTTGWRSDAPTVAAVTDDGLVTGMGSGYTNVFVTVDAVMARQTLRVVSDYHGSWTGSYRVDRCTPFPTAAYTWHCQGYGAGTTFPLSMAFSQNGEMVNGQFTAGGVTSNGFVAQLNDESATELNATGQGPPYLYEFSWRRMSIREPGQISGILYLVRRGAGGLVGGANIDGTIVSLHRP